LLSSLAKGLLFLSSYLPLWLVFVVVNGVQLGVWVIVPAAAFVAGVLGLAILFHAKGVGGPTTLGVARVERVDLENVTYVVTYLFPFVGASVTDHYQAAGLAILFVFLLAVYVRADLIHVNPVLTLLNWHVYRVESSDGTEQTLLTDRSFIIKGTAVPVVRLSTTLWREKNLDYPGNAPESSKAD